jgi:O-antigen ligase
MAKLLLVRDVVGDTPIFANTQSDGKAPCAGPAPGCGEWVAALLGLLILADTFDASLYRTVGLYVTVLGLPMARLPLLVLCVIAAILLARDWRGAAARVGSAWLLWPALALAFLSAAWSGDPRTTLLWAAALLGTSAFGVALALRFSPRAQAMLVAAAVAIIAGVGALAALVWPSFAIDDSGQWLGVYVEKNLHARVLALGMVATATLAFAGRRAAAAVALLLCAGIAAARSRASMLAALIAVAASMLLLAARRWRRHAVVILVGGSAAIILIVFFFVATPAGLELLARNPTFTDRTTIWKAVAAIADERPWLGHGYGAFWTGGGGRRVRAEIGYSTNQAHNGLVDLFAELGIVGVLLVVAPLVVFGAAALRHALATSVHGCIWPAAYLVFFLASNVAESAFLRHKIYWALYVAAACHVARRGERG